MTGKSKGDKVWEAKCLCYSWKENGWKIWVEVVSFRIKDGPRYKHPEDVDRAAIFPRMRAILFHCTAAEQLALFDKIEN
jgi:hypothetical protein